ncbi:MAG: SdpI family protein [bacterium]|nr:SdpI family protein [bacterium]
MGIWIMNCIIALLMPVILLIVGAIFHKSPPKKTNGVYGYRTTRSRKNQDTWDFSQKYAGELFWKIGWISVLVSVVECIVLWFLSEPVQGILISIVLVLEMVAIFVIIAMVEKKLKETFDDNGIRR